MTAALWPGPSGDTALLGTHPSGARPYPENNLGVSHTQQVQRLGTLVVFAVSHPAPSFT